MLDNIPADKKSHITLGLLIGLALGTHPLIALAVGIAVAIGKEVYDYLCNVITKKHVHDVEWLDAVCTAGGTLIGIGVVTLIEKVLTILIM